MCAQTCPEAQLCEVRCRSCLPPSDAAPERPRVPLSSAQRFERFVAAGFCPGHSTPAVAARAPDLASSESKERKVLPSVTKRRAYDLS